MTSQVYYVLGANAKGQPIAEADEVSAECGVMVAATTGVEIVRVAPKQPFTEMRFDVWRRWPKPRQCQVATTAVK